MPDFQRVNPGQDLVIPASTYNAFVDAAIFARSQGGGGAGAQGGLVPAPSLIMVLNDSSDPFTRFDAAVLIEPVILPSDNEDEFQNRPLMTVDKASDTTKQNAFGILQEPVAPGSYGRMIVSGMTVAWINVASVGDLYVDVVADSVVPKSGGSGPAQIVWVDGGVGAANATGEQWSVIRIGGGSTSGVWMRITGASSTGPNRWQYSWTEVMLNQQGAYMNVPGGRTSGSDGYAWNSIEEPNSDNGIQGNSIDLSTLPSGISLLPVQGTPVVLAWQLTNCNGEKEFIFSYENAIMVCQD